MRCTFPTKGCERLLISELSKIANSRFTEAEWEWGKALFVQSCLPAILLIVFWLSVAGAFLGQSTSPSVPVFTSTEQIRRLTPEQAATGYPIRIRGIVTNSVPEPDFGSICE